MNDFWLYFTLGFDHVLDFRAYDHLLFLVVLCVCFDFFRVKSLIAVVTVFSVGHTFSMVLACFDVVSVPKTFVEMGIALTILFTAFMRLMRPLPKNIQLLSFITTLFFGLIHGLGFSSYLKMLLNATDQKWLAMVSFALGIETVQIFWVLFFLSLQTGLIYFFDLKKRDWVLVVAGVVLGMSLPMIFQRF